MSNNIIIQQVYEYDSFIAPVAISNKINEVWFVNTMTSYPISEYTSRIIVVYEKTKTNE